MVGTEMRKMPADNTVPVWAVLGVILFFYILRNFALGLEFLDSDSTLCDLRSRTWRT